VVHGVRILAALLVFCGTQALAGDIFRHRTADGRTIFTDSTTRPERTIETARLDSTGLPARIPAPGMPAGPADRDRVQGDIRSAEADLMQAYNRLTVGVLPRSDELVERDPANPGPKVRGKPARFMKTPDYYLRIDGLKADVTEAQKRLDGARERYYALK